MREKILNEASEILHAMRGNFSKEVRESLLAECVELVEGMKIRFDKIFDECHYGPEGVLIVMRSAEGICGKNESHAVESKYLKGLYGYYLLLAIDKYGMGPVLEKLLPQSIIHEKHSKLNPINWLLWIFNKIDWSEVKVRSEFSSDKIFVNAIQNIKKMSESASSFTREVLYNNHDLRMAANIIIERFANASKDEITKVERLDDLSTPKEPIEKQPSNADIQAFDDDLPLPDYSNAAHPLTADADTPLPPPPSFSHLPLEAKAKTDPASSAEALPRVIVAATQNRKVVLKTPNRGPNEQNPQFDPDDLMGAMQGKLAGLREGIDPSRSNNRESGEGSAFEEDPSRNHSSFFSNAGNNTIVADSTNSTTFACGI